MEKESSNIAEKPPSEKPRAACKSGKTKPKELPPYHVVLLDDNDHSYEYVMEMLRKIFGYPDPQGFTIASTVDAQGHAIVFTTHREYAELKRDQIHNYGTDWRVATCQGSMSAVIRAADE